MLDSYRQTDTQPFRTVTDVVVLTAESELLPQLKSIQVSSKYITLQVADAKAQVGLAVLGLTRSRQLQDPSSRGEE
jgi:hypothetical protein